MENAKVMSAGDCDIVAKSPAGAAYVKKVTHPPTTIPQEYLGTPDSSAPNVVCMEVKGETNIAPILTYSNSDTTTTTANPGSMLFLSPSGGFVASYVFMQVPTNVGLAWSQPITWPGNDAHTPITNNTPPAVLNSGYAFRNWYEDVSSFRTSYKSETYYLNATNFNNQGTVTTAKFKPNILRAQSVLSILNSHENCGESTLRFVRALNLAINSNRETFNITKNGVSGPTADYVVQIFECNDGPDPTIRQPFNTGSGEYSALYHFLPSNATELMNLSSKSKTNPALDGAFIVHQPIDPVMLWDSNTNLPQKTSGPSQLLEAPVLSMIRAYSYTTNIYEYFPLFTSASQTVAGNVQNASAVDLPWNNLDWSITIFEGLTVPPTVGTTLSSVPYVTVKSYAGLELQPQFASSLRPFARLLPLPDRDALDIATCIFHSRPDALPASANDLGTIAATLFKYAPMVIDGIKTMFGMIKGEPKKKKKQVAQPKNDKTIANLERQMLTMQLANQALRRRIKPGATRYVPEPVRKLPNSAPVPKPRRSLAKTRRA
nr:hypothetical protein [Hepelivirales sp.]